MSFLFTMATKTLVRSFGIKRMVVAFAAKKVVEAVDTDLVAVRLSSELFPSDAA